MRATMPYTISFEEAAKVTPQIRDILMSYPQVTVVGSELGRPDDGTDPTGFFNVEFYVGLKPYKDKTWAGSLHTKAQLTDAIRDRLEAFPGIIFNFTQPAEDAVDEALTGLKSASGGKSLWLGLECPAGHGTANQRNAGQSSRIFGIDGGARAWPAEPLD